MPQRQSDGLSLLLSVLLGAAVLSGLWAVVGVFVGIAIRAAIWIINL